MCEIVAVHWRSRRPFGELLPWAEKVEHYGLGSFGWGVAWLDGGRVGCHRFPGRMKEDPYVQAGLLEVRSTHFLVHFRRPNKLSTVQLADCLLTKRSTTAITFAFGRFTKMRRSERAS